MTTADPLTQSLQGPQPAIEIARDLARRGVLIAPVIVGIGAAFWGAAGAASVGYALAIVIVNFLMAAFLLGYSARISFALMGAAALFGFLIRLSLIFVAVMVVRDASWVRLVPLGITLIVAHLGLLFWELRYVSGSLAYPGLKPRANKS
ncbi:MAG: ATP synthase subunit I [Acidimicrobiales bacterium]